MTQQVAFGLSSALLVLSSGWVIWQVFALKRGVAHLRKESSRFPMYEARDRLVLLVASGELSKNEKGWRIAYHCANGALDMHRDSNAVNVIEKFIQFHHELQSNVSLQARVREIKRAEEIAIRRSKNFKHVLDCIDEAFLYMVTRQSTRWHHVKANHLMEEFLEKLPKEQMTKAEPEVCRDHDDHDDDCPRSPTDHPRPARGEVAAFILPGSEGGSLALA